VRRQESRSAGARKPGKNPFRTAAFRETARAIVYKDRVDRRSGMSVDTAGAIARALEHAYAQGFAEAQQLSPARIESLSEADRTPSTTSTGPIEWILIPPRPRNAFWTICLFTLGRETAIPATASGHLVPTLTSMGRPGWRLITRNGMEEQFGRTTILPLLRLGLLQTEDQPEGRRLVISPLGRTTWQRFVERGGQFPDDLTAPSGEDGAP
jgi:hypothetical protein